MDPPTTHPPTAHPPTAQPPTIRIDTDASAESEDQLAPGDRRDLELVERALAGAEDAVEQLIDRLLPIVHRRAARVLRRHVPCSGRQDVEDLVQDLLLQLFVRPRLLADWRPGRGLDLESFVDLVSQRRGLSIARSTRPAGEEPDPSAPCPRPGPARRVHGVLQGRQLLHRLRRSLSETSWLIFWLRFVEGQPIAEICRRTGLDAGAVYARISRIRKAARRILQELQDS